MRDGVPGGFWKRYAGATVDQALLQFRAGFLTPSIVPAISLLHFFAVSSAPGKFLKAPPGLRPGLSGTRLGELFKIHSGLLNAWKWSSEIACDIFSKGRASEQILGSGLINYLSIHLTGNPRFVYSLYVESTPEELTRRQAIAESP